jgi:3-oxoacyl-[acyl-carrier-protein] synthase II
MKRVVVTGIGAVSPLGNSLYECWEGAKAGLSGIAHITRFDASEIKWKVAGELKALDAQKYLSQKEINRLDPFAHYAVAAATMAAEDAGLITIHSSLITHNSLLNSGGVIIGSSRGGISTIEKSIVKSLKAKCKALNPEPRTQNSRISPYLMPSTTISMASSYIAQKLGIKGYCLGISNACSSGTNAIGEAYRLIRSGYKWPVFCGGAEAPLCRICIEGYGVSGALSLVNDSSASRPFDRTRDGFVLSEGACILVLENYENASKRGVRIYGEIIGYGNTTDAFHQTIPDPKGEAMAIKMAINEAGLKPEDIDFINAHGTSTPLGDKIETKAIKLLFGKKAYHIPITSIKSVTGHMLAASGSLEAAFTLMSIDEGIIPPTINLKERDPECDLDYTTELRRADIEFAISHSFGFGGVNAVLVMKKLKDVDNMSTP